jgi:hypothetical protein
MNKARYIFAASAVFLSAALAAKLFNFHSLPYPLSLRQLHPRKEFA